MSRQPRIRAWIFSSVASGCRPAKSGSSARRVLGEEPADADQLKANAEIGGQAAAVVDGARGGVRAGHSDADHVLRAQGVFGDGSHQRGVDAAAQAHQSLAKAALAHVIARAQHQGPVGGLGVVVFGNAGTGGALKGSTTTRSSSNEAACAISSPRALRASEEPSKIRLSLPPTWLHISTGMRVAAGDGGQHLAADGALASARKARRRG